MPSDKVPKRDLFIALKETLKIDHPAELDYNAFEEILSTTYFDVNVLDPITRNTLLHEVLLHKILKVSTWHYHVKDAIKKLVERGANYRLKNKAEQSACQLVEEAINTNPKDSAKKALLEEIREIFQFADLLHIADATQSEEQALRPPKKSWISIVDIFDKMAETYPSQTAIEISDTYGRIIETYTYDQVASYINKLCRLLQKSIQPGQLIGVCLGKSLELYATIFALWKLGAVYVPLSPTLDRAQLLHRITDSGVRCIITQSTLQTEKLNSLSPEIERISLDQQKENLQQMEEASFPYECLPETHAYIIYTSGTTGDPKGILISHEGLPSRCENHECRFKLRDASGTRHKVLQRFDIRVDVSLMETILALCTGSCLCVSQMPVNTLIQRLPDLFELHQISVAIMEPTVLERLLDVDEARQKELLEVKFSHLEHLASATEKVTGELLKKWQWRGDGKPPRHTWNGYGPTETTIGLTINEYKDGEVTIGNLSHDVFQGTKLYVLRDGMLHLDGQGELCAEGVGNAVGYWGEGKVNEEKTKASFVELPVADSPEQSKRVYKTGDLVNVKEQLIYFLGRMDKQVKISGTRIELDSVITRLKRVDGIKDVYVTSDARKGLTAFILLENQESYPSITTLRLAASASADYNTADVPRYFYLVTEEQFREISCGKPIPEGLPNLALLTKHYQAPRNNYEEKIQKIWQKYFGFSDEIKISIDADFYDLGGYSLLLTQILQEVERNFGISLENEALKTISIQSLAKAVFLSLSWGNFKASSRKISNEIPLVFCLPPLTGKFEKKYQELQKGLEQEANLMIFTHPLLEPELFPETKELIILYLPDTLEETAYYLCRKILKIQPTGEYALCGYSFGGLLAYEIAYQLRQRGYKVSYLGLMDTQPPGELKKMGESLFYCRLIFIVKTILKEYGILDLKAFNFSQQPIPILQNVEVFFASVRDELKSLEAEQKESPKKIFYLLCMLDVVQANFLMTFHYQQKNFPLPLSNIRLYRAMQTAGDLPLEIFSRNAWGIENPLQFPRENHFNLIDSVNFQQAFRGDVRSCLTRKEIEPLERVNDKALENAGNFQVKSLETILLQRIKLGQEKTHMQPIESAISIFLNGEKVTLLISGAPGSGKSNAVFNWYKNFKHNILLRQEFILVYWDNRKEIFSLDNLGKYLRRKLKLDESSYEKVRARYRMILILDSVDYPHELETLIKSMDEFKKRSDKVIVCTRFSMAYISTHFRPFSFSHQHFALQDFVKDIEKIFQENSVTNLRLKEILRELFSHEAIGRRLELAIIEVIHKLKETEEISYGKVKAILFDAMCKIIPYPHKRDAETIKVLCSTLALKIACESENIICDPSFLNATSRYRPGSIEAFLKSQLNLFRELNGFFYHASFSYDYRSGVFKLKIVFTCKAFFNMFLAQGFYYLCENPEKGMRRHAAISDLDDINIIPPLFLTSRQALQILKDTLQTEPEIKKGLYNLLRQSDGTEAKETHNLAVCAATFLNAIGEPFINEPLQDVIFDHAIMPSAVFAENCILRAKFSNAILMDAVRGDEKNTDTSDFSQLTLTGMAQRDELVLSSTSFSLSGHIKFFIWNIESSFFAVIQYSLEGDRLLVYQYDTNTYSSRKIEINQLGEASQFRCTAITFGANQDIYTGELNGRILRWYLSGGKYNASIISKAKFPLINFIAYEATTRGLIISSRSSDITFLNDKGEIVGKISCNAPPISIIISPPTLQKLAFIEGNTVYERPNTVGEIATHQLVPFVSETTVTAFAYNYNIFLQSFGYLDGKIVQYNTSTHKNQLLLGHSKKVVSLDYSPNAFLLLSAGEEGLVKVWSAETVDLLYVYSRHPDPLLTAIFVSNEDIVSTSLHHVFKWKFKKEFTFKQFEGHSSKITALANSPDSKSFLSGCEEGIVKLWDSVTGQLLATYKIATSAIVALAFCSEEQTFKVIDADNNFSVISLIHGQKLLTARNPSVLLLSNHNSMLFIVKKEGKLYCTESQIISTADDTPQATPPKLSLTAISEDQTECASFSSDNLLWCLDIYRKKENSFECTRRFTSKHRVSHICYKPESHDLAAVVNNVVLVWDTDTGILKETYRDHHCTERIVTIAFSPNENLLISAHENYLLFLWSTQTQKVLQVIDGHQFLITQLMFCNNRLVSADAKGTLNIWQVKDRKLKIWRNTHSLYYPPPSSPRPHAPTLIEDYSLAPMLEEKADRPPASDAEYRQMLEEVRQSLQRARTYT